jgi:hypothetical protein
MLDPDFIGAKVNKAPIVITSTGNRVNLVMQVDEITLEDISVALGRMPRFCGHTSVFLTVLHHSMICYKIAEYEGYDWVDRCTCLIHDFHEAFTGDVPTPFKPRSLGTMQEGLDNIIKKALNVPYRYGDAVRKVDDFAQMAESALYGPPGFVEEVYGSSEVNVEHMNIARRVYETLTDTHGGVNSFGVQSFMLHCEHVFDMARRELGWT